MGRRRIELGLLHPIYEARYVIGVEPSDRLGRMFSRRIDLRDDAGLTGRKTSR
jgi:hypothetical protein